MELVKLKGPEIDFKPNKKLEVTKNAMLIAYVVLETLYKTIFGKYLAVEMERMQCVVGAVLACLLLVEWLRLDKDNKIKWVKRHAIVFIYFAIRVVTFVSIGFQYTMLRSVFFEGIYLLVLTELIIDSEFCKKIVFNFFIVANLLLNLVNTFLYLYCDYIEIVGKTLDDKIYIYTYEYTYINVFKWHNYSSMYSNPNQIGLMTGIAILIAVSYISKNMSIKKKIIIGIYFTFSLYCIIYSNCSSSHVALLVVGLAFILVKKTSIFTKKKVIISCLACCILATGCVYVIAAASDEFSYSEFESKLNSVSSTRYWIWKDSYYSHKEEALLGCGNMTLEKRDRCQYNIDKGNNPGIDINSSMIDFVGPHNGYIGTISCAGLLGFAAFLALLLKKVKDSKSLNQGYWYLAIIFILMINLFECMMPISKNFITLYMFLIISMDDRKKLQ